VLVNSSIRTATASVRTLLADAERTTAGINITVQQLVDTSAQIKLEQSQLFTNLSQFAAIPTGGVTVFSGATLPKGFLHCDGASLSRTRYVALFAVLGTRYGEGAAQDNSTFSLPDLRSRGVVGASGVTRTGAPVDLAAGLSNYPLSSTLGRATHTLLESELPSHTHVVSDPGHTHRATDLGHTHGASSYNFGPEKASWFTSGHLDSSLGMGKANIVVEKATSGIALEHTGRGNAFDIMPPSMALFFIIRT
jgi:microcystin-dependent protein